MNKEVFRKWFLGSVGVRTKKEAEAVCIKEWTEMTWKKYLKEGKKLHGE